MKSAHCDTCDQVTASALAQNYPVKLIRLISPSTRAAGPHRRTAHQPKAYRKLRAPCRGENRPGVSGIFGTDALAKSSSRRFDRHGATWTDDDCEVCFQRPTIGRDFARCSGKQARVCSSFTLRRAP